MEYSLVHFSTPVLNAAGTFGFTPPNKAEIPALGGFFTNPISLTTRTPAHGTRYHAYPGGMLLHTGLPNPGIHKAIQAFGAAWARSHVPVFVHLLTEGPHDAESMVLMLEDAGVVSGVELGLPPFVTLGEARAILQAAMGELPVLVRVSPEQALELAPALTAQGAAGIVIGPPRGTLPTHAGEEISGRMYGPSLSPQILALTRLLAQRDIPVLAGTGMFKPEHVRAALNAGALAVQIDTALWKSDGARWVGEFA